MAIALPSPPIRQKPLNEGFQIGDPSGEFRLCEQAAVCSSIATFPPGSTPVNFRKLIAAAALAAASTGSFAAADWTSFVPPATPVQGDFYGTESAVFSFNLLADALTSNGLVVTGGTLAGVSIDGNAFSFDGVQNWTFSGPLLTGSHDVQVVVANDFTGSYRGTLYFSANALDTSTLTAAPVPEPESYAMMLAGLGALGFLARRRQKQA